MDRWVVVVNNGRFALHENEQVAGARPAGVRLYHGDDRTDCEHGVLTVTSHRIVWEDQEERQAAQPRWLYLPLALVSHTEFVEKSFTRSAKVKLFLFARTAPPAPYNYSHAATQKKQHHFVLLSFRHSSSSDVRSIRATINHILQAKAWRALPIQLDPPPFYHQPQSTEHQQAAPSPGHQQRTQQQPSQQGQQPQRGPRAGLYLTMHVFLCGVCVWVDASFSFFSVSFSLAASTSLQCRQGGK